MDCTKIIAVIECDDFSITHFQNKNSTFCIASNWNIFAKKKKTRNGHDNSFDEIGKIMIQFFDVDKWTDIDNF